ncbi:M20 family metallopeptidase [Marinisporobacter balticus]|uniref:Glutamate carboxypeptidase n=1 Tax=Marinisporobacter balticus TaxID=2018667 RepID=A0A4R2KB83_9FIRM|nr:M20 family metallopeptidase [Marinisporobacter balticus]TCO70741.1 glutamate carboxypeptidase [Marinisporobacter balticus]
MYKLDLTKYLKELELLVNIDSGSTTPKGIEKVAEFFKNKYAQMGWFVKMHKFDEALGPCLEARNIDQKEIDLLLIGHMDTVFPEGTAKERPFTIKGDIAYGPGVVDMKSALLSMYYVLESLNFNKFEKLPAICVALNSDEEISSIYSKEWIKELAKKSKYAVVLEPARKNGALVKERKGILKYNIEFTGVAAHAGANPQDGISAITELGYWIGELDKLNDLEAGTTVNVGVVSGGTVPNVVAEKANAVVDVRFKTENAMKKVEEAVEKLAKNPKLNGIKINITKPGFRPPMKVSKEMGKLYKIIDGIGETLNIHIEWVATGGGSDANLTAFMGVPTVDTLGPVGGGAHGIHEYLEINSIEPRVNLLREFMITLFK